MDLISLPAEFDKEKIDGRFRLTTIAAQRARELALGAKPNVPAKSQKVTTMAIEEAINGMLEYIVGEEARKAREEARKIDYRRLLEERKREGMQGDLSELEKDLKVYLHERESDEKKALEELFTERTEAGAEE